LGDQPIHCPVRWSWRGRFPRCQRAASSRRVSTSAFGGGRGAARVLPRLPRWAGRGGRQRPLRRRGCSARGPSCGRNAAPHRLCPHGRLHWQIHWQVRGHSGQGPPERPLTWGFVERTTGFEPATLTFARCWKLRPRALSTAGCPPDRCATSSRRTPTSSSTPCTSWSSASRPGWPACRLRHRGGATSSSGFSSCCPSTRSYPSWARSWSAARPAPPRGISPWHESARPVLPSTRYTPPRRLPDGTRAPRRC
jgi:hypothetical protein